MYLNSVAEKIKLHPKTANHATKSAKTLHAWLLCAVAMCD